MGKYGDIRESEKSAEEYRVDTFLYHIYKNDFGNGGFSREVVEFLEQNREEIQDAFVDYDSAYILPATKKFAKELYEACLGDALTDSENSFAIADEVDWLKLGNRYWLRLWWD